MLQPNVVKQLKKLWRANMDKKIKITLVKSIIGTKTKAYRYCKAIRIR